MMSYETHAILSTQIHLPQFNLHAYDLEKQKALAEIHQGFAFSEFGWWAVQGSNL